MTFTNQAALHGPTPPTKKRAALYLRVSGKQQETEGSSLISQEDFCLSYCQEHNYTVDPLHIYREVHTGKVYRERPVLTEVRAAAKRREFDVLVVYELDRFARKQVHQAIVIDDLQHHGVAVESVKDPNDDSPQGQFLRSALGFVAEMEREKIVERTQRGKLTRVQSGKMLGQGVAAYGYEWADAKKTAYIINLVEAEIVRKLFDMVANGCSLHGLTRYLYANSIPSPDGKAFWRKGTISRLLRNPYYIGKARVYKHTYVPRPGKSALRAERPEEEQIEMPAGVVPAIVSVETFEKVQRQLQINKERSTRNNRNPEATLLRGGIAVCGHCNGNLIVHRDTTRGKNEAYYRCQKSVHDADWHPILVPENWTGP